MDLGYFYSRLWKMLIQLKLSLNVLDGEGHAYKQINFLQQFRNNIK